MTKARLCQAVARTKLGQAGPGWARLGRDMERHGKTWKGMDQAGPGWARLGQARQRLGGALFHTLKHTSRKERTVTAVWARLGGGGKEGGSSFPVSVVCVRERKGGQAFPESKSPRQRSRV